jgi:hypothetical protein
MGLLEKTTINADARVRTARRRKMIEDIPLLGWREII